MTIYIDMAIAVAFSLRLGRGAIMAQMREHPGVKMEGGILPPTLSRLRYGRCQSLLCHQENNCRPRKSKERRATVLRLCEKRAMPWWRIVVQILNTSPRDGIRYTEMWRQVSQKTILDSFGSRNLARCRLGGVVHPKKSR